MTKGYGVRAREIEGQNALALMLYFVYMMEGRNSQDQITSDRSKRAWSGYVLFVLKVGFY